MTEKRRVGIVKDAKFVFHHNIELNYDKEKGEFSIS
jgi:hypothetical protein